jgi:hypothetical protein
MSAAPAEEASGPVESVEKKLADIDLGDESQLKPPPASELQTESSSVAASLREKPPGPLKTPIVDPVESAKPVPAPTVTADQEKKYEEVLDGVKSWKEIPSTKGKDGPITDNEIMWLTRECILRYLRATKWSTAEAQMRLLGTLTWRRDYGVEQLTGDHISPENETGKQIILGYDNAARPCLYLNPGRQNTETGPRQVQHLVFMVESVIEFMVPGQETLALLINFKASKGRSNTGPPIGQGREVLNILQTHYPERLGRAYIINSRFQSLPPEKLFTNVPTVPWLVHGFFKLISPFIDPVTKEKLKFNEDMRQHAPPQQLWNEFQGDVEFEYDHSVYWPAMLQLCEERRREHRERWVKAGKQYGESELYLKGGSSKSVGQASSEPVAPTKPEEKVEKEDSAIEPIQENGAAKIPVQTNGSQSNGNTDIMAQVPEPVLSTEGDRA